ncbi:effector binding domain-containing protein [Paenibacillus medicaginis]|uniref:Effector binding domain-containing protein n=1 Tax=Paenibacillus medicaginis TaxID=1470560 RepID=A0ABV5C6T4_9BACL
MRTNEQCQSCGMPINSEELAGTAANGSLIQPLEFVEKEAFTLAGKAVRTTNAAEMTGQGLIPGLWASFLQEDKEHKPSGPVYACYTDYENGVYGKYTFLLGHIAPPGDKIPDGLSPVTLPAARYAVFRTEYGPLHQVVAEAWQRIWQWPASVQGLERTFSGDFELYNEFAEDAGSGQADIYIAVR